MPAMAQPPQRCKAINRPRQCTNVTAIDQRSCYFAKAQFLSSFLRTSFNSSNVQVGDSQSVILKITNGPNAGKTLYSTKTIGFYQQYALDAVASGRFLIATDHIYESFDGGDTLKDLGVDLSGLPAPSAIVYGGLAGGVANPNVFYVAAGSSIYFRQAAGAPPTRRVNYTGDVVTSLAVDPANYNNVFVVDAKNHVWASSNAGSTWADITGNLATLGTTLQTVTMYSTTDDTTRVLLVGGLSLTGSQGGVFRLTQSTPGASWVGLGSGLPNAIVSGLVYNATDDVLVACTIGRGAWEVQNFAGGLAPLSPAGGVPSPPARAGGKGGSQPQDVHPASTSTRGPVRLTDINPLGSTEPVAFLTNVNGTVYFTQDDGSHGRELWKSNGTAAGTVLVKDINPGSTGSYPTPLGVIGGTLYFAANDGSHGYELWKTDGTSAGTVLVKDINTAGQVGSYPSGGVVIGSSLYFAADDGLHGDELWKTDGTFSGTFLVKDINSSGNEGSYPTNLTAVGGTLYFAADDGSHGDELWKSDGTPTGTQLVLDINTTGATGSSPHDLTAVGGTLYFAADDGSHGDELWKSDSTGTALVTDINPGSATSYLSSLAAVGGTLYFAADDGIHGTELWKSDSSGTILVKDINPSSGSYPIELVNFNGTLYFTADDGTHGYELWKSNGTSAGTALVSDINPGDINPGGDSSNPSYLTVVGGTLYFAADDGSHGEELWKTDGTTTTLVQDINSGDLGSRPGALVVVNGTLYFRADDGRTGPELWRSNGTSTALVLDISPGKADSVTNPTPSNTAGVGGTLYFTADDGSHGDELWKTDGTSSGTQLVQDINPGSYGSSPHDLTAVGGTLYFAADDGSHGDELWKTDGTTTVMASDINLGSQGSFPHDLVNVNGTLYFVADDGSHGDELWKTNGTSSGTVMVLDINPGEGGSAPTYLTAVGGTLYFRAFDGSHGEELWKTDATGTSLVKDINPGATGSFPVRLTAYNGLLYFVADDGTHGNELWQSDGTFSGTQLVADINPAGSGAADAEQGGQAAPGPVNLTVANGLLYFAVDDGASGNEPWVLDATPPTAALASAPNVTTAGGTTYTFTVTYGDNLAIDVSTLDSSDVVVSGPHGFSAAATFVSVTPPGNGTPRTATYTITPPGGSWTGTADGTYTIALRAGQVADTSGNTAPAGSLGTFAVVIPVDVTSQVSVTRSGLTYNRAQKRYYGDLTVSNTGAAIAGGFRLVLHGVPSSVSLDGATINVGGTAVPLTVQHDGNGDWEVLLPRSILASLASGASFKVTLKWNNPLNVFIDYTTKVFSDPGL